jgi:CheY-like chemotaxis protein
VTKPKLLLVDDEQAILDGLKRGLRGSFDVRTATSGADGLALLAKEQDIAVVMSDMRMPIMSGAAFLAQVAANAPDAVRILLTGQADMEDTIAAINEGRIFRFLRKPCDPDTMRPVLAAAVEQHRLVTAERELLEQTLRGAVQALCDTLALASPGVFGSATRVKHMAAAMAAKLQLAERWPLEVAAMVCQLGAITLPPGLYERRANRAGLTLPERAMLDRVPVVTEQLLAPIPRLEPVRDIVRASHASVTTPRPKDPTIALASRILRAALDFEEHEAVSTAPRALERMRAERALYGEDVVEALASLFERPETAAVEIHINRLEEGMIIAGDIISTSGVLIVARGHEVTLSLIERLQNFIASLANDSVQVHARPEVCESIEALAATELRTTTIDRHRRAV